MGSWWYGMELGTLTVLYKPWGIDCRVKSPV